MKILKIVGIIVCAYLLFVAIGLIWTQIWLRLDKKRLPTETEKRNMGQTGILAVNDRIWISGGYEMAPEWLGGRNGYFGTVKSFIHGQNDTSAAVVILDEKITAKNVTGDILVMELRWVGAKWGDCGVVHLELCNTLPENKPWKERKQGKWIESHASYEKRN